MAICYRTRWRLAASLLALIATACNGDAPTSPTISAILPDGDYVLSISLGVLPPVGGSPTFCISTVSGPQSATAAFPVQVTGSGQSRSIRMPQSTGPGGGSLLMMLTIGATTMVTGTIAGTARTADDAVAVTIPLRLPIAGTQPFANRIAGQIDGDVRMDNAQGSITCRSSSWTLAPR